MNDIKKNEMKNYKHYLLLTGIILFFYSCRQAPSSLYLIQENRRYGYIDSLGNEVIKPQYLYASNFQEGIAIVIVDTIINEKGTQYKYGYISTDNRMAIDTTLVYTFKDDKGELDVVANGECLSIKKLYCSNDRILFQDSKTLLYGYMNKRGDTIVPPKYVEANNYSEGLAPVNFGNHIGERKWGYIDVDGNVVIKGKYSIAESYSQGVASVGIFEAQRKENGRLGMSMNTVIIDTKGHIQCGPYNSFMYSISAFHDSLAIKRKHLMALTVGYRFIDMQGRDIPDFDLEEVTPFANGYAGVKLNTGKWVFVDKQMNIVSEEYEDVEPFSEGYASIKENGSWGYIDTTFQVKIPCKYDRCSAFKKGLASFSIKNQALVIDGYVNKKGKVVWQKEYSNWN